MSIECSIWDQDCASDEKCNPWARNGSPTWNATRCVPLDPDPSQASEPCIAQGGTSGFDDCGLAELCFGTDAEGNGTCVSFCGEPQSDPVCPEGLACAIMNEGVLALCLPTCDPLAPDCAEGEGCFPVDATFVCLPAPTDAIMRGNCYLSGGCEPGTVCLAPLVVPGCEDDSGCCSPWCDFSSPECPADTDCLMWFEEDQAPPEYANVGVCGVLP